MIWGRTIATITLLILNEQVNAGSGLGHGIVEWQSSTVDTELGTSNSASVFTAIEYSTDAIDVVGGILGITESALGSVASTFTGLVTLVGGFAYEVTIDDDARAGVHALQEDNQENKEFEATGSVSSISNDPLSNEFGAATRAAMYEAAIDELGI